MKVDFIVIKRPTAENKAYYKESCPLFLYLKRV